MVTQRCWQRLRDCIGHLYVHKLGTLVVMAAGERGWIVMDRWWGYIAGKRLVREMMPPCKNLMGRPSFASGKWPVYPPTVTPSCSRLSQTSSNTYAPTCILIIQLYLKLTDNFKMFKMKYFSLILTFPDNYQVLIRVISAKNKRKISLEQRIAYMYFTLQTTFLLLKKTFLNLFLCRFILTCTNRFRV